MMKIQVKSYNELKKLAAGLPDGGILELPDGATVAAALDRLTLPGEKQPQLVLFVNGRPADPRTGLRDGDTLVLFAPMSGG